MLECQAEKCVHNHMGQCHATVIQVKQDNPSQTCCHTYCEIPLSLMPNDMEKLHQRSGAYAFLMGDGEYAEEFFGQSEVACSASHCLYNVHYTCKARHLRIGQQDNRAVCRTYYPL